MKHTIYKVTNKVNGKIYIGAHSTEVPNDNYYGSGKLILRALKKYGTIGFEKEVLFIFATKNEMYEKEKELVTQEFVDRKDTYNIVLGGDAPPEYEHTEESKRRVSKQFKGITLTEAHKEKISKTKKTGYHPYRGKKLTDEHKEKNRQAQIGRTHSEETKAKMRLSKLGKNNPNYGKSFSKDHKEKLSASRKGKMHSEETKAKMAKMAKGNSYGKGYKQTKEHVEKLRKAKTKEVYDTLMIYVDYEEFYPETYQGVYVYADKEIKRYNTGDFKKDFVNAKAFARRRGELVIFSSTVDQFLIDS